MSGPRILALDLGSTGVRALVVDGSGTARGRAYARLPTEFPAPGRVEQSPDALWSRTREVARHALAEARIPANDLAAIGIATQRATALAWDARTGRPLAPAVGWQDQRSGSIAARLQARGLPISTQPSVTKWMWWLQHEPAVREAARRGTLRLGTPDAWLGACLTGGALHVTDPGQASCTGLYDLAARDWSDALLGIAGIDRRWLPAIVPSSAVVAESAREVFGGAVALAARAGDQQAASFAQGVHAPGDAKLTLGTAAMLDLHTGEAPASPAPGAYALALWRLDDGREAACLEGSVITAGAAIDWAVQAGLLAGAEATDRVARSVDSSEGVVFVPALQGLGTPFLDDGARGWVGGLTRGSTAAHVVRALVDGIAHRCTDVAEALAVPPGALRVDGGLSRSDVLVGRIADLTGREVWRAAEIETTALGAALLAGLATGVWDDLEACRRVGGEPARFAPGLAPELREAERARWRRALDRTRSR